MKKMIAIAAVAMLLAACGSQQADTSTAPTKTESAITAPTTTASTIQLTINSPDSNTAEFTLHGLATETEPTITCDKMIAAKGGGTQVTIALIDLKTVDQTVVTIKGIVTGPLTIDNAEFTDVNGHLIPGQVEISADPVQ